MTYLYHLQTIAQDVGTSLLIHNQRMNGDGANLNASWLRKGRNKPGGADKRCFPAFQNPNSKNLRAAFRRRMAYLQFETKTKKIKQQ